MYLYRCKRRIDGKQCDARNAKRRPLREYARAPRCWSCGLPLLGYVDNWQRKNNRETTCRCDGLPYPHRIGSDVWCAHHPIGPSEEDFLARFGGSHAAAR